MGPEEISFDRFSRLDFWRPWKLLSTNWRRIRDLFLDRGLEDEEGHEEDEEVEVGELNDSELGLRFLFNVFPIEGAMLHMLDDYEARELVGGR